ncbi:MAG: hypothetical protein ACR2MC_13030 [Actinomycetota bacterium]
MAAGQLGLIKPTTPEQIIIGLLGLLAIDAIAERVGSFNRIERLIGESKDKLERKIDDLTENKGLRSRIQLPPFAIQAASAREIWILAVHGTSVIPPNTRFFSERLRAGVVLKIVLLDPNSKAGVEAFELFKQGSSVARQIHLCLEQLRNFGQYLASGQLQVRLTPTYMPFSMLATDPAGRDGEINVEYQTSSTDIDGRPHVRLTATDDPYWSEHYREEFRAVWNKAEAWDHEGYSAAGVNSA